jgi:cellulose synthase/poly-beta-1,6-N-acetylglucosamine synthase-like glycosyltransferase
MFGFGGIMVVLNVAGLVCLTLLTMFLTLFQMDLFRRYWRGVRQDSAEPSRPPLPKTLPKVTIQLPLYNESAVAERLLDAVSRVEYPRDKLQIQVLDDSTDGCSEILREKVAKIKAAHPDLEIVYRHRIDRTGYKAGNLEEGTTWATGELVAIFDADFVPRPDYLMTTVRYFDRDDVAIVQSRWSHLNSETSLVTKAQQFFLDGHLSVEQRGRKEGDLFLIYNGSAGIWRKQVVIDCGGWITTAAIEDVDMSYRAQLKGWKIVYLEDYTTPGELPDSMIALRLQLFRWWKGGLQIGIKYIRQVWAGDFPLSKKLHATIHLFGPLMSAVALLNIFLAGPVPIIATDYPASRPWLAFSFLGVILLPCLFLVYGTGRMRFAGGSCLQRLAGVLPMGLVMVVMHSGLSCQHTVAAIQAFVTRKNTWVVTPKGFSNKSQAAGKIHRVKMPWYFWLDLGVIAYLIASIAVAASYEFYLLIVIQAGWLLGYLWTFGGAVVESYGPVIRRIFSTSHRAVDAVPATEATFLPQDSTFNQPGDCRSVIVLAKARSKVKS